MGVCQSTKTESNSVLQTQNSSDLVHNEHWGQKVRGVGEAVIEEHLLSNHQNSVSIPCKSSPHKPFTSLLLALKSETAERFRDNKSLHSNPASPLGSAGEQHSSSPTHWLGHTTRGGFAGLLLLAPAPFTSTVFCFPLPKISDRFATHCKQPMAYGIWEYGLPLASIFGNHSLPCSGW